jgi:hypothetical protein
VSLVATLSDDTLVVLPGLIGASVCRFAVAVDAEALDGANAAAAPPPKNQVVLELTEQIWRDAIDLYGLEGEESIIPTREAFVPPVATGKYKW